MCYLSGKVTVQLGAGLPMLAVYGAAGCGLALSEGLNPPVGAVPRTALSQLHLEASFTMGGSSPADAAIRRGLNPLPGRWTAPAALEREGPVQQARPGLLSLHTSPRLRSGPPSPHQPEQPLAMRGGARMAAATLAGLRLARPPAVRGGWLSRGAPLRRTGPLPHTGSGAAIAITIVPKERLP